MAYHVVWVRGWPCSSKTGLPLPPWRTRNLTSPTSTVSSVKSSNTLNRQPVSDRLDAGRLTQPTATSSMHMMLSSLSLNHAARPISGTVAMSPSQLTPGMS
jgi:hypothetical protein